MAKRIDAMEIKEIIRRLRTKESIWKIHHETGLSRDKIRDIKKACIKNNWINRDDIPTAYEINKYFYPKSSKEHPLDKIKDKIKRWVKYCYTYLVITKLINEHYDFNYNEITVRRYIKKTFPKIRKAIIRRTFNPGEYAEVDFGFLKIMYDENTKRNRKVYLFSMRLCYSRKTYRELVFAEDADTFFRCHMHAFEYFGKVPKKVVCDNLKAAVIKACIYDPLVNRSYKMLAEHYNFLISPCLPRKPEHKGGVEKDMSYVKRNYYPLMIEMQKNMGRKIPYYSDAVKELERWTKEEDDVHIVKYTGCSPVELFEEEKNMMQEVKTERWNLITWYKVKVGDDWSVQINKVFYSVPYRYIGEHLMAYANSRDVVIFNADYEQIAMHKKALYNWQRVINSDHAPPSYEKYLESTSAGVKRWAKLIGDDTSRFVEILLNQKGVDGLRPARGLCNLSYKYGSERLNNACKRALHYNLKQYHQVKKILDDKLDMLELSQINQDCYQLEFTYYSQETFINARSGEYYIRFN